VSLQSLSVAAYLSLSPENTCKMGKMGKIGLPSGGCDFANPAKRSKTAAKSGVCA